MGLVGERSVSVEGSYGRWRGAIASEYAGMSNDKEVRIPVSP
jgi:hypothetical protein